MNRITKIFPLLFVALCCGYTHGQDADPMLYQRWNIMNINRVTTKFNNTGLLCDGNEQNMSLAHKPSFEYPSGSGVYYGTAVGVVIGAPAAQDTGAVGGSNPENLEYCDATLDEGSAAYWDEEHFAPFPSVVNGSSAPISTDKSTWPTAGPNKGWPALIPGTNEPLVVGSEGWPGIGKNGERIADQETYSAMYSWQGTDIGTTGRRYLRTTMEMRGFAWTGELYQDFIVWMFVIRNNGTQAIKNMRVGVHSDFGYLPIFSSPTQTGDADRHYWEPRYQLAWGCDDDSYEVLPNGNTTTSVARCGTMALRMPGATKKVETYDAFHFWIGATSPSGNGASKELYYRYNLSNQNDPKDSDHDGIDDDFDGDGIPDTLNNGPGYYLAAGADGIQTIGSGAFNLAPGQTDTLIFATVFGATKDQLFKNAKNALTLFKSNWQVVRAPAAPEVEIIPQDGKNTIYMGVKSEWEKKFEGYKIYRSVDGGVTWGTSTYTDFSGTVRYIPLEQYDKVDSISGNYKTLPEFAWFNLGTDRGLPTLKVLDGTEGLKHFKAGDTVRVYIDNNSVINGQTYRYYVAAYDTGNGITGPLENTPATTPGVGTNTVIVVPHAPAATESMNKIKVVPNPYVVASGWEVGSEKVLQFTHLPSSATIKIFNVSGELVKTIHHEAGSALAESIAVWNLLNENHQLVAAGLYFYSVESSLGTAKGKFIVIQ